MLFLNEFYERCLQCYMLTVPAFIMVFNKLRVFEGNVLSCSFKVSTVGQRNTEHVIYIKSIAHKLKEIKQNLSFSYKTCF